MSAIDRLLSNYSRQVRLPWSAHTSGKQRVWFAVYPPAEERRVRARLPQFEALTLEANHGWTTVDLTDLLPNWVGSQEYREGIFAEPEHFSANSELEDLAVERVRLMSPAMYRAPSSRSMSGSPRRSPKLIRPPYISGSRRAIASVVSCSFFSPE